MPRRLALLGLAALIVLLPSLTGRASDPPAPRNRPIDTGSYLIMTSDHIRKASARLSSFVQHKRDLGFQVDVVTESDFGDGTGDEAAENVRAWLRAHYLRDKIKWVLIIGDPRPETGPVPMKLIYTKAEAVAATAPPGSDISPDEVAPESQGTPTDYYYANLTGEWDVDGDGKCGEIIDDAPPSEPS